jgi:glyoxylase-like metal-dependent hydrolase (beta-lactamase superfamily II)
MNTLNTNIHTLSGGDLGVNTYFIPLDSEPSGSIPVLVIDPGIEGEAIPSALKQNHFRAVAIVLTHRHFDHVLGLAEVCKEAENLPIGIHPDDDNGFGAEMQERYLKEIVQFGLRELCLCMTQLPSPTLVLREGATLDALFPADGKLASKAAAWQVLHTPGHTPGSICLYNKAENTLISGDTLFAGTCGRTDLLGGSEDAMRCSLARLSRLPAGTAVYPGHGPAFRMTSTQDFDYL